MAPIFVRCTNFWLHSGFPSPQVTNPKILTFVFQLRWLIFNKKKTHVTPKVYKLHVQGTVEGNVFKGEWIPSTDRTRAISCAGRRTQPQSRTLTKHEALDINSNFLLSFPLLLYPKWKTNPSRREGYRKECKKTCVISRAPSDLQTQRTALCTSSIPKYFPLKP